MFMELLNFTFVTDLLLYIQSYFGDDDQSPADKYRPDFTEFQIEILKTFSVILAIVSLLIVYYWNKYGDVITERFIRPSMMTHFIIDLLKSKHMKFVLISVSGTLKEIEELKLSVARLKLPKEHTPRI